MDTQPVTLSLRIKPGMQVTFTGNIDAGMMVNLGAGASVTMGGHTATNTGGNSVIAQSDGITPISVELGVTSEHVQLTGEGAGTGDGAGSGTE